MSKKLMCVRLPEKIIQQLRLNSAMSLTSIQSIVQSALESHLSHYTVSDIPREPPTKNISASPIEPS